MKIYIGFKTPDALEYALEDAYKQLVEQGLDGEEIEDKLSDYENKLNKYIKYGECINVEFDLESKEVKVVKVKN